MNPLHFAGGEGQVSWMFGHWHPGTHVQDTRIAVRAVAPCEEPRAGERRDS